MFYQEHGDSILIFTLYNFKILVPRRVINFNCDAKWEQGENRENVMFEDNVEPEGINFYRVHANYFYGNENRKIRVQGQGYGTLNVCYSRQVELPV